LFQKTSLGEPWMNQILRREYTVHVLKNYSATDIGTDACKDYLEL
jgi:hypothetical protein